MPECSCQFVQSRTYSRHGGLTHVIPESTLGEGKRWNDEQAAPHAPGPAMEVVGRSPHRAHASAATDAGFVEPRSEERRVEKESRSRWSPDHQKKKNIETRASRYR